MNNNIIHIEEIHHTNVRSRINKKNTISRKVTEYQTCEKGRRRKLMESKWEERYE